MMLRLAGFCLLSLAAMLASAPCGVAMADDRAFARARAALAIERLDEAEQIYRAQLAEAATVGSSPEIRARALVGIAEVRRRRGYFEEAATQAREALALSSGTDPVSGEATRILGDIAREQDRFADAIELCYRAAATLENAQPLGGIERARALACAGAADPNRGYLHRGRATLRRALAMAEQQRNPSLQVSVLLYLADFARTPGRTDAEEARQANQLVARAAQICRHEIGEPSPCAIGVLMYSFGTAYEQRRWDDALRIVDIAEQLTAEQLGTQHYWLGEYVLLRAVLHRLHDGNRVQAIELAERARRMLEGAVGSNHRSSLNALREIAANYAAMGRLAEAEALTADAERRARITMWPYDQALANHIYNHAVALAMLGRQTEADALMRESEAIEGALRRHFARESQVARPSLRQP